MNEGGDGVLDFYFCEERGTRQLVIAHHTPIEEHYTVRLLVHVNYNINSVDIKKPIDYMKICDLAKKYLLDNEKVRPTYLDSGRGYNGDVFYD